MVSRVNDRQTLLAIGVLLVCMVFASIVGPFLGLGAHEGVTEAPTHLSLGGMEVEVYWRSGWIMVKRGETWSRWW